LLGDVGTQNAALSWLKQRNRERDPVELNDTRGVAIIIAVVLMKTLPPDRDRNAGRVCGCQVLHKHPESGGHSDG
jgi:hypothetical protein